MGTIRRISQAALALALALSLGACVVSDDEYEEARRQRDDHRRELQDLNLENAKLNQAIAEAYADYDALSARLAVGAALALQLRYTEGLASAAVAPPRSGAGATGSF
jgi:chromosome segregation ATPase